MSALTRQQAQTATLMVIRDQAPAEQYDALNAAVFESRVREVELSEIQDDIPQYVPLTTWAAFKSLVPVLVVGRV